MPQLSRARPLRLAVTIVAWCVVVWLIYAATRPRPETVMTGFSFYKTDFPLLVLAISLAGAATVSHFTWGRKVLRTIRTPIILITVSTLLTLGALELFLRIFDPLGISYYSEMSRYLLDRVPDAELKARHRQSWEAVYQGAPVHFNEVGLRDDTIGPKAQTEYRILVLGDSQSFGWGVACESIWPARLQSILSQRLRRPVRVINGGHCGYDSRQEYRYLMRDGWRFDPDLILLMFMDNDLEISDDPYDPWGEKSFVGKSPGEIMYLLVRRLWLAQLVFRADSVATLVSASQYEPQQFGVPAAYRESMRDEFGWKQSMAALEGIRQSVQAHDAKLAVVHFDWISFPYSEALLKAVRDVVAPFPVVYVPPWFAGENVRKYFNSVIDAHPNAEGHRVLAEHIADFILSQHWASPASPVNVAQSGDRSVAPDQRR